jgi:hypothetical protein
VAIFLVAIRGHHTADCQDLSYTFESRVWQQSDIHGGTYTGDSTGLFLRPATRRKNGGSVKEAFVS